jgi:hypothetical protein
MELCQQWRDSLWPSLLRGERNSARLLVVVPFVSDVESELRHCTTIDERSKKFLMRRLDQFVRTRIRSKDSVLSFEHRAILRECVETALWFILRDPKHRRRGRRTHV